MSRAATPAIAALIAADVPHEVLSYHHDPRAESFGAEAVAALAGRHGVVAEQIFKTLIVNGPTQLRRVIDVSSVLVPTNIGDVVLLNGDATGDGEVDLSDVDAVIADYLQSSGASSGYITDLDMTGEVDLNDLDIVANNYGRGDE